MSDIFEHTNIFKDEPHEILKFHSKLLHEQRMKDILKIPIKSQQVSKKFKKSLHKIRGFLLWSSILKDLRIFGTNSHLFDSFNRYRKDLEERLIYKKRDYDMKTEAPPQFGYLIDPESPFYQFWNMLVLLMLLYAFIVMPWVMAFEEVRLVNTWYVIETYIDCVCFLDILVTLNTAYYDLLGRIVSNRRKIFMNYLKGLLMIDLISITPFYLIENGPYMKSNSLIRIVRITSLTRVLRGSKLIKLIKYLKHSESIATLIRFLKLYRGMVRLIALVFCVIIMSHFVACMFYFTAKLDNFGPHTWVTRYNLQDSDKETIYLRALYFTITILTTVGFGDITPDTYSEMILCIAWMVLGIAFYSTIVSSISSLFSSVDSRRLLISEHLNDIDKLGKYYEVSSKCLKTIKQRISDSVVLKKRINEFEKFKVINEMPRKIQNIIVNCIYKECVKKIKFLKNKDFNFLIDILPRLRYIDYESGVIVYNKHEVADSVYFLLSGRVSYVLGNQNTQFKTIVEGTYFGEIEVLMNLARKFRVITDENCEILAISSSSFDEIMGKYPLVRDEVLMLSHKRNKTNEKCYKQVVKLLEMVEIKQEAEYQDLAGTRGYLRGRKSYMSHFTPWNNLKIEDSIMDETQKINKSLKSIIKKVCVQL